MEPSLFFVFRSGAPVAVVGAEARAHSSRTDAGMCVCFLARAAGPGEAATRGRKMRPGGRTPDDAGRALSAPSRQPPRNKGRCHLGAGKQRLQLASAARGPAPGRPPGVCGLPPPLGQQQAPRARGPHERYRFQSAESLRPAGGRAGRRARCVPSHPRTGRPFPFSFTPAHAYAVYLRALYMSSLFTQAACLFCLVLVTVLPWSGLRIARG